MSAKDGVEPASYRASVSIAQSIEWQAAMQHDFDSMTDNGTWEVVDLHESHAVGNNMWTYKIKSDT
jgi:hypothetical protein